MKKIFIIAPLYPFPPVQANQKDITGRIRLFQELGYQVSLFPFPLPEQKFDIKADEKNYGLKIALLYRKLDSSMKSYRVHKLWYQTSPLINKDSIDRLTSLINKEKPDILWFEYSALAPLAHTVSRIHKGKIIFRNHNYELMHHLEKEYINLKNSPKYILPALLSGLNIFGIMNCEKLMFNLAKSVAFISTEDLAHFKNKNNAGYLPYFPPDEIKRHEIRPDTDKIDVFYFGSDLRNNVNRSGLDFIAGKILPVLRKRGIDFINFHVLGKNPPPDYTCRDVPNLSIHGFIEDLNEFLKSMDAAIVPVFYGRGFKVKAYEALKRGFPVIGTARALSNFDGISGEDYFIADKPDEYAKNLLHLRNADIRMKLGANAAKLIARDFSKEKVIAGLRNILEN
ncbi:glycosyltransferase [Chloroflexota bacterium]